MTLGVGIDTGGTFTDSAIVDLESGLVRSKAKALTTRQDLRIGIANSLSLLNQALFSKVRLVALTTLATNSVVEGKGSRVGLIVAVPNAATFNLPAHVPALQTAIISGAHDRNGEVAVNLDEAAAYGAVTRMAATVDTFAVSCYFSIYNAEHEAKIKALISAAGEYPVVCGHELSADVGLIERAVTACLNARLLPVVSALLQAVKETLIEYDIRAPLMIVRGDGSLITEEVARLRPVETVLSGPAASVVGACRLTGIDDAVVVDMGGTTTDIAVVTDQRAATSINGAIIGGWQTRVKAADLWTAGIGGDSKIMVSAAGEIRVGPRRAIPICSAAHAYPPLKQMLEALLSGDGKKGMVGLDFFTLSTRPDFPLSRYEAALIRMLDGKALHKSRIDADFAFVNFERLIELGSVAEISFTPTDLLVGRGDISLWDKEASELALRYLTGITGIGRETICDNMLTEVIEILKLNIAGKVLRQDGDSLQVWSPEVMHFFERLLRQNGNGELPAAFRLKRPLVAVGAPVKAFFPRVASELGARLVIPEHSEVANAVGAVTGRVVETVQAYVRPDRPFGFTVIGEDGRRTFDTLDDAVAFGEEHVRALATERALRSGGRDVETSVFKEEVVARVEDYWGGNFLIELKLFARAVGKPAL
ncbi:MAG: hydantoinase/oxoprolinase family protein [Syntrophorhabdales bacterium]